MKLTYLIQIKNPRNNKYYLIDKSRGIILKSKNIPFNNIELIHK